MPAPQVLCRGFCNRAWIHAVTLSALNRRFAQCAKSGTYRFAVKGHTFVHEKKKKTFYPCLLFTPQSTQKYFLIIAANVWYARKKYSNPHAKWFQVFFFFFFEMTTVPALESFQYMAVPILFEIGKIIGIVLGAPVSWQTFMQQL